MQLAPNNALDEYEALPACIRAYYTFEQYQWLSGFEKAHLVATETEPDQYED